jgi:hypothetical protein
MNNKHQENGALRDPLILTVPAYGFVMALYLDWLGRSKETPFSAKTFSEEVERSGARDLSCRTRPAKKFVLLPTTKFHRADASKYI